MICRTLWLLLLVLLPCCGTPGRPPSPPTLELPGGFSATVEGSRRLQIHGSDGRVLIDGLPPAEVRGEQPPLVGFAVRDAETSYEMQFGSFKPTLTARGPWRVASWLAADGATLTLLEAGAVLATITFSSTETGHLILDLQPGAGPERQLSLGFSCAATDHFAGLGAQSLDVDHRGFTVPTWVQEQGIGKQEDDSYSGAWFLVGTRHASQVPIPQLLSRRGYIVTVESDLQTLFALCSEAPDAARVEVTLPARLHLFDGPTPAQALTRATARFGRPRMPPRVALAPWIDAIQGSQKVREVARRLREEKIPASVIWSEDWRGGQAVGDRYELKEEWEVDRTLYPDLESLSRDLHAAGFDFHVYFNPFVYRESKAWAETQPRGWLVKRQDGSDYTFIGAKFTETGLLDLDQPAARAWAVQKMRDAIALGADGWMNDYGEWLPTDGMTGAGPSLSRHNLYPVLWQQTAREAIDGVKDGQERLFFSRSGWLGTAPLADVVWAGDQRTSFAADDGLPTILPIGIGLGLSGISTYGHDIGGYQSSTNPPSTRELFFRWTALGAFSPVMRTHHGTHPLQQWSWQSDQETIAHFRRYAALHMSLVPYLEGLARIATDTGLPIWRGLMLAYPDDLLVWALKDQVLLGGDLLVAPVTVAGALSRSVYLPAGRWYPWSGGTAVSGPASISVAAPVTEIPVFARAGAVIPTYPDGVMTLVHGSAAVPDQRLVGDDRVVLAFLGAPGKFDEAGGLGYAMEMLAQASGPLQARASSGPLAACASPVQAPCLEATGDGAIAHLLGPGSLAVLAGDKQVATLTATGGAPTRQITWVIRR